MYTPYTAPQAELTNTQTQDTHNTQVVHERLAKMQRNVRRGKIKSWASTTFMVMVGFLPFAALMLFPSSPLTIFLWHHLPYFFVVLLVFCFLTFKASFLNPTWNFEELARTGGVEAVGTLIELMAIPGSRKQFTPLLAALTNLLPQMKASDARLLTAGQRRLLHRTLDYGSRMPNPSAAHQDYLLAVLKALEQVGDADALPIVTQIANGRAQTVFQKTLQAAAQQCLPLLQVHLTEAEADQTLLRASSPERSSPELLLRPATFTSEANPKQLLRAADTASPLPPASGGAPPPADRIP